MILYNVCKFSWISTCKEETEKTNSNKERKENNQEKGEATESARTSRSGQFNRQAKAGRFVCHSVPASLVPSLFPEHMQLWKLLQDTDELKDFIHCAADDYLPFYDQHSKGKEKYANLYLTWLKYISSFTCKSQQLLATLCRLALLFGHCRVDYWPQVRRTVIASILHAVQEGMQSQMANMIATFETDFVVSQLPSANDDTALYHISDRKRNKAHKGWHNHKRCPRPVRPPVVTKTAPRWESFSATGSKIFRPGGIDIYALIPTTLATCCRGKHTRLSQPRWIQEIRKEYFQCKFVVEISSLCTHWFFLQITKDSVVKDRTSLEHLNKAVKHLQSQAESDTTQQVHTMLLSKIYNEEAMNFLLLGVSKLQCIKSNKAVDVNIGLRDQLKCYAAEKHTLTTE